MLVVIMCNLGNCRDWRSKRSIWHNTNGRQLYKYCQGGDVGTQRLWQHRQIPAVSTDCQLRSSHCRVSRRVCDKGQHLNCV